jgi:Rieske 2Fe-2S family protein
MTTTRTSGGATTLPRHSYTSPEIFERERQSIFRSRWICVGLAADIPEPGNYMLAEVAGDNLIVVRDRTGAIRAFHNVCRHRGTRLCENSSGMFGKHIVCPYHAWAYDLDGRLAAAPIMDEVEGFERADYPLHAAASALWEGLIFINLSPEPEPFESAFAPVIGKFTAWGLDRLAPAHRTEYEVAANWKLMVQNYSECYHCPSLHPALNKLTPFRNSGNDLTEGAILGGPMLLSSASESMTMDGRLCASTFGHLHGEQRKLVHYYVFFPSMFLSLMPDYAMVHRVIPRDFRRSTIVCQWLFDPETMRRPDFDATRAVEFWDMTNRQDWHICEQSQLGIESSAYTPGPYANLESMIAAVDREYLRALGRP